MEKLLKEAVTSGSKVPQKSDFAVGAFQYHIANGKIEVWDGNSWVSYKV